MKRIQGYVDQDSQGLKGAQEKQHQRIVWRKGQTTKRRKTAKWMVWGGVDLNAFPVHEGVSRGSGNRYLIGCALGSCMQCNNGHTLWTIDVGVAKRPDHSTIRRFQTPHLYPACPAVGAPIVSPRSGSVFWCSGCHHTYVKYGCVRIMAWADYHWGSDVVPVCIAHLETDNRGTHGHDGCVSASSFHVMTCTGTVQKDMAHGVWTHCCP